MFDRILKKSGLRLSLKDFQSFSDSENLETPGLLWLMRQIGKYGEDLEKQITQLNFAKISIFQPSLLTGDRLHLRLAERLGALILPLICLIPGLQKYRPIQGSLVAKKMLQVSQQQQNSLQYFTLDKVFPD